MKDEKGKPSLLQGEVIYAVLDDCSIATEFGSCDLIDTS